MDSCHHVCWGRLPFRHPGKAVLVQVFFIPPVCHQLSLSSLLLYLLIHLLCTAFLVHSLIFCFPSTSSSLVWPTDSGCCRSSFIPSSSAYLCESFTRDSHPVWAAFSSNSRSSPIGGSGLAWKCTAGMIIYWWSCILLLLISFLIPLYFGVDRAAQWSQVGVLPHSRPWSFWSRDAVQWWARCESTWSMSAQGTQIDWLPSPCCNQTVGSTISLRPSSTTLSQHSLAPCCLHVSCSLVLHEISTGSLHSNSWLSQVLQFSFQPNPPAVLVWHVLL